MQCNTTPDSQMVRWKFCIRYRPKTNVLRLGPITHIIWHTQCMRHMPTLSTEPNIVQTPHEIISLSGQRWFLAFIASSIGTLQLQA